MRAVHVLAICAMATIGTAAGAQDIDWKKVDEALGRTGAIAGDVHRYGFPRTDLQVTLDGVTMETVRKHIRIIQRSLHPDVRIRR